MCHRGTEGGWRVWSASLPWFHWGCSQISGPGVISLSPGCFSCCCPGLPYKCSSVAYTTHLTTSTGVASHELKAIFDLPSLSLPLASYLLYYGCLTSLREGPLPWAKQLFSCGISRWELAAKDCLLVALPAVADLSLSFLKGNMGGIFLAWVYLWANIVRVLTITIFLTSCDDVKVIEYGINININFDFQFYSFPSEEFMLKFIHPRTIYSLRRFPKPPVSHLFSFLLPHLFAFLPQAIKGNQKQWNTNQSKAGSGQNLNQWQEEATVLARLIWKDCQWLLDPVSLYKTWNCLHIQLQYLLRAFYQLHFHRIAKRLWWPVTPLVM